MHILVNYFPLFGWALTVVCTRDRASSFLLLLLFIYFLNTSRRFYRRNKVAHASLDTLAMEKNFFDLAAKVRDDLRSMADVPLVCRQYVDSTKKAMITTAMRYFSIFDWDDGDGVLKDYTARTVEEIFGPKGA